MVKLWIANANQYREVKPLRKVTIPGYEEYKFYATMAIEPWNKELVNITEARTGEIVGTGHDIREARASALAQLKRYTKDEIDARIELRLERHEVEMASNKIPQFGSSVENVV